MRTTVAGILIMLLMINNVVKAQNSGSYKCSVAVVLKTNERLSFLSERDVSDFLHTFDSSCSLNGEYSEYSNEILFTVLEKYPQYCLNVLTKYSDLDKEYIYQQIKRPIQEYDIQRIILAVKFCDKTSEVQRKIIAALEVAEAENR